MYNGVDTELFMPAQADMEGRHSLHTTLQDTVFAFAGRLVGWKGMEVAIRAMAAPILQNIPAKLLIIGDGPQTPQLKRLSAELNISERIIFHGSTPHRELPSLYANIDVGVFPSIADEAFGITIAEAMSCGKPVIASHIGGIPEVVGNEKSAGILVPPGDPQALAQAMYTLAADSTLRKTMGSAARARITELYTWKQAAARLLNALDIHAPDLS
jgi:glycosyltransferase involved in cell wall biosynthesis